MKCQTQNTAGNLAVPLPHSAFVSVIYILLSLYFCPVSLFLLFFCTRICVYAAENQDFSREEEVLGELDLKEVEMAVDQLLEEKQSMRGMIRDILKSGQAFSAEQWKAVIRQGVGSHG